MLRKTNLFFGVFVTVVLCCAGCKNMVADSSMAQHERNLCNAQDVKEAIHPGNKEFSEQFNKCGHEAWGR